MLRVLWFLLLTSVAAFASDLRVVVQSPSGDRVAGVEVAVFRADGPGVGVITTAGDGSATFSNLTDGSYRVVVRAPGFAQQEQMVSLPQAAPVTVALKLATAPQTVVVSATSNPTPANETATSVGALNAEQITVMNPVAAGDALQYIPGAYTSDTGRSGNLTSLFVRGGESNYNKVIVDGVPVNEPGGIFDFGVVSMNNVQRMEVERGAESSIYGSDAMTSVVQLWSVAGDTRTPEVQFGADGGTFSTAHGYLSVAGAARMFDFNLFGDQFNTEGQGVNDTYSNSLQGGNVGVRLSQRVSLRVRARHSNNRTGIQNNWWFNGDPVLPPDPNQYARQNNFLASVDLTVGGPGPWQHLFRGFEYNHSGLNVNPVNDPDRPFDSPFDSLAKYNRAGFSYQGTYTPRSWAVTTLGYTFEDENGFINNYSDDGFGDISISNTHGLRRNHYLFAQENVVWKRATVADRRWATPTMRVSAMRSRRGATASYMLFTGNSMFSGTRLRAGYSEGIKEPSFEQSFGITGTYPTIPNPNLKPEQNHSVEAGVEQGLWNNRLALSAVFFHNDFLDQIEYEYNALNNTSQYVNFNRAMAQGAELELRGQITESPVADHVLHLHFDADCAGAAVRSRPGLRSHEFTAPVLRCCAVPSNSACSC